jgi:hypothetical protein
MRQDSVMIDSTAVRCVLKGLPSAVPAVALSANHETSEEDEVLRSMGVVLEKGAAAVVSARAASEAVKVVEDGWAVGSVDRASLITITLPILIDLTILTNLLASPDVAGWLDPVRAIVGAGGAVRAEHFPG